MTETPIFDTLTDELGDPTAPVAPPTPAGDPGSDNARHDRQPTGDA